MKSLSEGELRALVRDAPARIGPYRLLRRLGTGGMAEVFLAAHEREPSRHVVIKRMLPQLAGQERFVDMFRRESRVAMRLDHPNVVKVYGLVEDGAEVGLVMEYLEGLTLYDLAVRAWDSGRSLPLEPLVKMLIDAAKALHFAHHLVGEDGEVHTIVHRDVSPDNLLVTKQGLTKLLDFGVAKPDDDHNLTRTGQVKGKVSYMSPEQARGEKLDGRSDLFSLGVSFYWLLTGVRPFDRDNPVATMEAVILSDLPRPSELNPRLPRELELVVLRLMERDRRFRTASGQELSQQLEQLLKRVPKDHMSPARLLENVLDSEPVSERPWPTHVAVPSVDWTSGERHALSEPSSPRPLTGDWAALQTRQLPVWGRSELSGDSSGVFTEATLEAVSDPASFDRMAPTIPLPLDEVPHGADTVRMPPAQRDLRHEEGIGPPTVPLKKGGSTIPSDVATVDGDPLTGPVTIPSMPGPELLLPPRTGDPDTEPEIRDPPTFEAPAATSAVSVPDIVPEARAERRPSRAPLLLAAALVSVALSSVAAWLVMTREDAKSPTSIAKVTRVGAVPTPPEAASREPTSAPIAAEPTTTEPTTTEPTTTEEPTKASADPEPSVATPPERRQQTKRIKPRKNEPRPDQTVRLSGPAHLSWKAAGKTLPKGTAQTLVAGDVDSLSAFDTHRRVRASVPIKNGVADYQALLTEELVVRVRPWAKVWLGAEELGLTPLKPVAVVPGRYKLKLVWEDKTKEQVVRVKKGGGQVIVNIDMRNDD